jgi:hypothetical protein
MNTEKEEHMLDCGGFTITYTGQEIEIDGDGYVRNTEVKLDDKTSLRLAITTGEDGELEHQVYFSVATLKQTGKYIEEVESQTVDWFWGFGDDGRPFDMDTILKEYKDMSQIQVERYTKKDKVFHLYSTDQSTYYLSIKAKSKTDAYKLLDRLKMKIPSSTNLYDTTNLSSLIEEYVDKVLKTLSNNQREIREIDITEEQVPTIKQLSSMITLLQEVSSAALKLKLHLIQIQFFLKNSQGKILE